MLRINTAPSNQISRRMLHKLIRRNPQSNRSRLISESTHRTITSLRTHNIHNSRNPGSKNSQPSQKHPIRKRSQKTPTLQHPHNRPRQQRLRQRHKRRQNRTNKNQNQRPRLQPQNPHQTTKTTPRRISKKHPNQTGLAPSATRVFYGQRPLGFPNWPSFFGDRISLHNFGKSASGNRTTTR